MRRNKEQNEPSVSRRNCAHSDRNIAKRGEDTRNQYKKSNWCKLNHERQTMFQALEPAELAEFLAGAEPLPSNKKTTTMNRGCLFIGADYVSRCGQLSVVSIVANAQKQGAE